MQEIREKEIDMKIEDIENSSDTSKMFKAVGTLYRQKYENPKVEDDEGRSAKGPNDILKLTTDFFKAKFQKEDTEVIQPLEGEPRPLVKEITTEEIHESFTKLNNNKATGEDGIPGELLKYSPKEVKEYIAQMINDMFRKHQPLKINNGNMRALQKPNKPKGPRKNLRPVTPSHIIKYHQKSIINMHSIQIQR